MILLTTGYDCERISELKECLRRNIENDFIKKIHLFIECDIEKYGIYSDKLIYHNINKRPTFSDLFYFQENNRITIVANSDISFDNSIGKLNNINMDGKLIALSRWELTGKLVVDPHGSQDCWIFTAPCKPMPLNFYFGAPGCDNHMVFIAKSAGYNVINPCNDIKITHVHKIAATKYTAESVVGQYDWVHPTPIETKNECDSNIQI